MSGDGKTGQGPLAGLRVVEFTGLGPAPLAGQLLADHGAEVVAVDRKSGRADPTDVNRRGKRSVALDLRQGAGVVAARRLLAKADVLIEGFRPGVMERLGLGPEPCLQRNPKLVYGRITGWGQSGPLAQAAGHDINYIALTGALHAIGTAGKPVAPLNLVGDFGGGAMFVAFGIVCALLEAGQSGRGQVVDAAMTDGAALLMAMQYGFKAMGHWKDEREANLLDGGAPFYGTYECADGKWLALGPIEPPFHDLLVAKLGLPAGEFADRWNPATWPRLRKLLADTLRTRTRAQWCELLEGTDACVAPVLDLDEAPRHPHNVARQTFVEHAGVVQPAPAPRFSRTAPEIQRPPAQPGEHGDEILSAWGFSAGEIDALKASGAV